MEVLGQLLTATLRLEESASQFLDVCLQLKNISLPAITSHSRQVFREDPLDQVQSRIDSLAAIERRLHESRAVLSTLLNASTSRVPIHRLPPETLSRIFAIAVSSTSCHSTVNQRDILPDLPLVCTRWHQIATSNRSLWSHIDEDQDELMGFVPGIPEMHFKEMPQSTKEWLLKRVARVVVREAPDA